MKAANSVRNGAARIQAGDLQSEFGPAGTTAGVRECPDLFPLAVDGDENNIKWALVVNINPGGIAGGSGSQYFIGDFDGRKFTAEDKGTYTPPTGTLVRDFEGTGFGTWTTTGTAFGQGPAAGAVDGQGAVSGFDGKDAERFGLKVRTGAGGEETVIGYDTTTQELYVDRTRSGAVDFHNAFSTGVRTAPLKPRNGKVKLRVLVDWSSVEVFGGSGEAVITDQIFPDPSSTGVDVFAEGGTAALNHMQAWQLRSIWR